MDLNASDFKATVAFRINSMKAAKGSGGFTDGYTVALTTRGMIKFVSGSSLFQIGTQGMGLTYKLYVRYQPAIIALLSKQTQVRVNGTDYKMNSWQEIDQQNRYFELTLETKTA